MFVVSLSCMFLTVLDNLKDSEITSPRNHRDQVLGEETRQESSHPNPVPALGEAPYRQVCKCTIFKAGINQLLRTHLKLSTI